MNSYCAAVKARLLRYFLNIHFQSCVELINNPKRFPSYKRMSGKLLGEFAFSVILFSLATPGFESALSKQRSADDKCPQTLPGNKKSFGKSLGALFLLCADSEEHRGSRS